MLSVHIELFHYTLVQYKQDPDSSYFVKTLIYTWQASKFRLIPVIPIEGI